jgi:hypothetical protein
MATFLDYDPFVLSNFGLDQTGSTIPIGFSAIPFVDTVYFKPAAYFGRQNFVVRATRTVILNQFFILDHGIIPAALSGVADRMSSGGVSLISPFLVEMGASLLSNLLPHDSSQTIPTNGGEASVDYPSGDPANWTGGETLIINCFGNLQLYAHSTPDKTAIPETQLVDAELANWDTMRPIFSRVRLIYLTLGNGETDDRNLRLYEATMGQVDRFAGHGDVVIQHLGMDEQLAQLSGWVTSNLANAVSDFFGL